MSHFSSTPLFKKLSFAVPCPSGQAGSLANGLLKTNIKVRLEYELKFSNLGGIFVEGYFLLFDCHTFKNML